MNNVWVGGGYTLWNFFLTMMIHSNPNKNPFFYHSLSFSTILIDWIMIILLPWFLSLPIFLMVNFNVPGTTTTIMTIACVLKGGIYQPNQPTIWCIFIHSLMIINNHNRQNNRMEKNQQHTYWLDLYLSCFFSLFSLHTLSPHPVYIIDQKKNMKHTGKGKNWLIDPWFRYQNETNIDDDHKPNLHCNFMANII